MSLRRLKGLEPGEFIGGKKLVRDVRTGPERAAAALGERDAVLKAMLALSLAGAVFPEWSFICFGLCLLAFSGHVAATAGARLPFRLPGAARRPDPGAPAPGRKGLRPAGGIFFLGNEQGTGKELWLDKRDVLTHMLLMGSTGSGKTAALVSLAYNALATGAGLFYIDPKAEAQLGLEIWQLARYLGRDDDFRVLNYSTAQPPAPGRLSNTNNPFSSGSADALTQVLGSLIPPSAGGANSIFADKALALISGLMYALTDLRDRGAIRLSAKEIRGYLSSDNCIALLDHALLSERAREALLAALRNCNYVPGLGDRQPTAFHEQYGYAQSYFGKALSSLTDTYEHIYGAESGEVDFQDVVLNRRILLTLLPSMEKSPAELSGLGKITLSSVRAAASVGLGLEIEGRGTDVLGSLPVHYRGTGPFLSIVDEYAAIVTPGFEFLLTQGRGLGMATVVASQDYAGIAEADRKGAQQIVANTSVKVFMRLAEADRTWELLRKLAGDERVLETRGFTMNPGGLSSGSWRDDLKAQAAYRDTAHLNDLLEQTEGEAHCLLGGLFARARLFHAGPELGGAVMRVPRLLEMDSMDGDGPLPLKGEEAAPDSDAEPPVAGEVRDAREIRGTPDAREILETRDAREVRGTRDAREVRDARETWEARENRDARDAEEIRDDRGARDGRETREVRAVLGDAGVPAGWGEGAGEGQDVAEGYARYRELEEASLADVPEWGKLVEQFKPRRRKARRADLPGAGNKLSSGR
ncbi:MAG: TraM recognition domain-containing protein [Deltaproteobacteria bacterium]|jgi:intracellular multiplication protein IcmO|nr:TraM recognition domain-containing protein [Deltaproteobacteria bacterium]